MRLPCLIIGISTIGFASMTLGSNGVLKFPDQMAHIAQLMTGRRPSGADAEGLLALPPVRGAYDMIAEHLARPVTLTELGFHPSMVQVPSFFTPPYQIQIQEMPKPPARMAGGPAQDVPVQGVPEHAQHPSAR